VNSPCELPMVGKESVMSFRLRHPASFRK
jgi:hypothetical protein